MEVVLMTPREKAAGRAARAPPKPGSKERLRTFHQFKEKKFVRAIEIAKELDGGSREWGIIAGSEAVKNRLLKEGLSDVVANPLIANQNELILNRARNTKESNFFVFIKFNALKTSVMFTDPTPGNEGRRLKRKELVRLRNAWRDKTGWAKQVAEEIEETSEKKPGDKFFAVMHGHWGENRDDGVHRDDGVSRRKNVIRQFMRWHYDVDATGYHNWVHETALRDILEREKDAGIVKVPSLEFTMAFNRGARNGPHLNWWFKDVPTAIDACRKLIWGRGENRMPGLAPNVEKRVVLREVTMLRKENSMALGIAHPSCILNVVIRRLPVGLLNLLTEKDEETGEYRYNWRAIRSFVENYADGVGEYNPTLVDYPLRFDDEKVREYFREKVDELVAERIKEIPEEEENPDGTEKIMLHVDEQITHDAELRENTVSYAFAQRMKEKYRVFTYFDHDAHVYASSNSYDRAIGPLAYGRTVISLTRGSRAKMDSETFVRLLRDREFRNNNAILETETFLELHKGRLKPVKPRRDALYKIKTIKDNISHGGLNLRLAWMEVKRTLSKLVTTR
ncbi:hypothetical protein GF412_01530 [Candidatus Micrarchaeota archaeon]|nr:hypothetical protein [Candidatus Micrarchaeota archaeon]MBD3417649.1 hypothetical protein [Candidatus Micrarchaeota archaeon]